MEPISASAIITAGSLLLGGSVTTLTGKIVWEWLQIRKNGNGTNGNKPQFNSQLTGMWQSMQEHTKQTQRIASALEHNMQQSEAKEERQLELMIQLKSVMEEVKDYLRKN